MTQFMSELMQELFPICRSISGVRESLAIIRRCIPMEIKEVTTGARVFDWSIPSEWNIRDNCTRWFSIPLIRKTVITRRK